MYVYIMPKIFAFYGCNPLLQAKMKGGTAKLHHMHADPVVSLQNVILVAAKQLSWINIVFSALQ